MSGSLTKCMTPDCGGIEALALGRGVCMKCYSKAKKLVTNGTYTWEQLEQAGLVKAKDDNDPFTKAMKEKLK